MFQLFTIICRHFEMNTRGLEIGKNMWVLNCFKSHISVLVKTQFVRKGQLLLFFFISQRTGLQLGCQQGADLPIQLHYLQLIFTSETFATKMQIKNSCVLDLELCVQNVLTNHSIKAPACFFFSDYVVPFQLRRKVYKKLLLALNITHQFGQLLTIELL